MMRVEIPRRMLDGSTECFENVSSPIDAIELLLYPKRLIATLRR